MRVFCDCMSAHCASNQKEIRLCMLDEIISQYMCIKYAHNINEIKKNSLARGSESEPKRKHTEIAGD